MATSGVEYTITVQGWGGIGYAFSLTLEQAVPPVPPQNR